MIIEVDERVMMDNGYVKASRFEDTLLSFTKVAQMYDKAVQTVINYVDGGYIKAVDSKIPMSVALVLDFPAMKKEYLASRPPVEPKRKNRRRPTL